MYNSNFSNIPQNHLGECQTDSPLLAPSDNCKPVSHMMQTEPASAAVEPPMLTCFAEDQSPNKVICHLIELLGDDVTFLPCPTGKKGCRDSGWQETTAARMHDPTYINRLNSTMNIAVLLGEASGGLCSIDIDHDADVEPFLQLNPGLRATLMSRGGRGANIWIRVLGSYPKVTKLTRAEGSNWGEWRATGGCTMIEGLHPDGMFYTRFPEVSPVAISFNDIVWPEGMELPWLASEDVLLGAAIVSDSEIVQGYGSPVFYGKSKSGELYVRGINEAYWAALFAAENVVLHEPDERTFFRYADGTGLYSVMSPDAIKQEISSRMLEVSRQDSSLAALENLRTDKNLNAVVAQLRGIIEHRNAFTDRSKAVHLANCMLRFEGDQCFREGFAPTFRSRNRSPIPFESEATCPRFLNELLLPAVHSEDAILLQKMAGQCLLGENLVQRFVILDGKPGRGKSQYGIVLQALIGRENVTQLRTDHLGERFELFRFLRRTLLVGVDVDENFLSSKGAPVIKGLVGGDWFDAEQKNGTSSFQFQGKFNILMTSNSRLKVKLQGDVGAWRRRMLIVRYEAPPPKKKIPDFGELLIREEGPGIMNWALEGLRMLLEDIQETGDIRLMSRQSCVVDSLLAESDSLRFFLSGDVVKAPGCDLTVGEIVQAYAHYCPDKGWEPLPESQIGRQLPSLMLELFQTVKSNSCQRDGKAARGFRGVAFRNPEILP